MRYDDWFARQAKQRQEAGLVRRLALPVRDGAIDLAGNDYLGFARDQRVTKAAALAAIAHGAGSGSSRLVSGNLPVHEALESALASWTGHPAALAFSTGYHANLATVTALSDDDTLLISDAHIHASMIDACRLSVGTIRVVPHNDFDAVEEALTQRYVSRAIVLVESIYSVLGDAAPLGALADMCLRYGALLVVDEAHALGVAGDGGRGLVHAAGLSRSRHVIVTATLSKALGSQGGALMAHPAVIDQVVNVARPFIYDTALAPTSAAAATAALEVLEKDPAPVERLHEVARKLGKAIDQKPAGAVMSVPMGSPEEALAAQVHCAEKGVRVGCFRPPSTPDGSSRLRLTASARLSDDDVTKAIRVLKEVL